VARPLVIVESPAKAKTIARFLGDGFDVRASVGHVADLPSKGLAVDVENDFKPTYELTPRGKEVVRDLRVALKNASELLLATDEDREGEAISWHLLEHLKPTIPVKRMVFHEITRSAIDEAVANPRGIDYGLVDAAETRRVLDRLYGYEVSPVLWRRINRGLSAGRVQSPMIRLIVERERQRIAFRSASYWDLDATFTTTPRFTATLVALDSQKVATGRDFGSDGRPTTDDVIVLDEMAARGLVDALTPATFSVRSVEDKPYRSGPRAPFMTSTLQQEGGRKLRLSAQQVMRVAQALYERGYITYMRTDSTALSDQAVAAARAQVSTLFGQEFLSERPRKWETKVKNAQEAHEAIRPAGTSFRTPADVRREVNDLEFRLYELIWMRTLASQMADARGRTVTVRITATATNGTVAEFSASGTTITFPGYRRAYVEGVDEGDGASSDDERILPVLAEGDLVPVDAIVANGHATTPPARYTEASLVKKLEELGIGRPSTWASIIQNILDRGYVWKRGQALVPTWTAFAVVNLLERHFDELVDYAFTARLEDDLDAIARNEVAKQAWLRSFYFGDHSDETITGLKQLVEENLDEIHAAEINTFPIGSDDAGNEVVIKPGKYGPYVKRGEDTASVPEDLAPDELTLGKALELLDAPKSDKPLDELDGYPIYVKTGRYGPYVQWGDADAPPPGESKPKMASLLKTQSPESISFEEAVQLLSLPRVVGVDADGVDVIAANGRYGPYVSKGKESRSLASEDQLFTVTLPEALALLAQPRQFRGRAPAKPPLREFGADPTSGRPVVAKEGRFGAYVTDGETNASIGRGDRVEQMTAERAFELLAIRRDQVGDGERGPSRSKRTAKKAAAKKTSAKETSAKKTPAKKSPAKGASSPRKQS
jgi:DNA topoisomerase-1